MGVTQEDQLIWWRDGKKSTEGFHFLRLETESLAESEEGAVSDPWVLTCSQKKTQGPLMGVA